MVDIQITVFDRQVKPDPFPEPLGLKIKRSITSVLRKLPVEQNDYNYIHVMDWINFPDLQWESPDAKKSISLSCNIRGQ